MQRWVIGQCLCTDTRSLASYGVARHGDTAFLYLLSARQARLTRQLCQQDQESALLTPNCAPTPTPSLTSNPTTTLVPTPAPTPPNNGPASNDWRGYSTLPSRLSHNNTSEYLTHRYCTHTQQHCNFHFSKRTRTQEKTCHAKDGKN